MKHFLLSIIFYSAISNLFAQKLIFAEDFQDSSHEIPASFQTLDLDAYKSILDNFKDEARPWIVRNFKVERDNYFAATSSYYFNGIEADDWLISPKITLTNNNFLKWRARNSSTGPYEMEVYQVLITTGEAENTADYIVLYESKPSYFWENPTADLRAYAGQEVHIAIRGIGLQGLMLYIDDIEVYELEEYDLSLQKTSIPTGLAPKDLEVSVTVKNLGAETITAFEIHWELLGTTYQATEQVQNLNLKAFEEIEYTLNSKIPLYEFASHDIKVSANLPDYQIESNASLENNTRNYTTTVGGMTNQRKVIMEKFTGVGCWHCPRGTVYMDNLAHYNPNIIPVVISTDSPAVTSNGLELFSDIAEGAPSASFDRFALGEAPYEIVLNTSKWPAAVAERLATPTPAIVKISKNHMPDSDELEVIVEVEFTADAEGDFRFNAYVIEDNISGGREYHQGSWYDENLDFPEYFGLGNPILGYKHNHIVRDMLGGTWGGFWENGEIPDVVKAGDIYSKTFFTYLDRSWNWEELELIGYVIDYDGKTNSEILNADKTRLIEPVSTSTISQSVLGEIELYPNPANTQVILDIALAKSGRYALEIVDILGHSLLVEQHQLQVGQQSLVLEIEDFAKGMYYVRLHGKEGQVVRTLVVQ